VDKQEERTKEKSGDKSIGHVGIICLSQSERIDLKRKKRDRRRSRVIFPSMWKKDGVEQRWNWEDSVP
jgi:hypothetical protein